MDVAQWQSGVISNDSDLMDKFLTLENQRGEK
jgi:hypothetical protein